VVLALCRIYLYPSVSMPYVQRREMTAAQMSGLVASWPIWTARQTDSKHVCGVRICSIVRPSVCEYTHEGQLLRSLLP